MEPYDYSAHTTENSVLADICARQTRVEWINGQPFAIIPGELPALIEEAVAGPRFVLQTVELDTLASFINYIREHSGGGDEASPVLFATRESGMLSAVFDYHETATSPGRGVDVAGFTLRHDDRYTRWSKHFDEWISQDTLADLIDRNQSAMVSPPAADMLALAENLEIHQSHRVTGKKSMRNGVGEISYETDEGPDSTKIPAEIVIGVPIYKGLFAENGSLQAWQIRLRIRYRISNQRVVFQLVPEGLEEVLDQAWSSVVMQVTDADVATVFEGARR
jgi:uncharacterized protein YfdQ (DUF2303 family)